ncbi:hypothetical protein [Actibacterium lipolyticum]|uniref:Uncharacterized protein n=1 Tax=Actibacterium lipolyticum TaxID=1524263 RepID=A0A238KQS2_9RHOB|nr:hypothetical protein [Actibacterium lipolyticum]SMX45017.1 hypothetical protein COL8621_02695 [Actibacterium lipolyticum]
MSTWILRLGVLLLFGLPILLLNVTVLSRADKFTRAINGENTEESSNALMGLGRKIDSAWGNHKKNKRADAIFSAEKFTALRQVTYTQTFTVDALLADGEEAPAPEFHELWVQARAPKYMMQGCDLPLATFAQSCAFSSIDVDEKKDGFFKVTAELAYLPAYPLGDIEGKDGFSLETKHVNLPIDRSATRDIPISAADEVELDLHHAILEECTALREEKGTCAISNFQVSRKDNGNLTTIAASGTLKWLNDPAAEVTLTDRTNYQETEDSSRFAKFAALKEAAKKMMGGDDEEKPEAGGGIKILNGGGAFKSAGDGSAKFMKPESK